MEKIEEGEAIFYADTKKKISRDLEVFYNPVMRFNRDMTLVVINSMEGDLSVGLPLAGTGIRALRLLLETDKVGSIDINDHDKAAVKTIQKNLDLNNLKGDHIKVSEMDANDFLLSSCGYDYIDIDPFGSPNNFLDAAVKRISRRGILAVTATDTAPLCGTYPSVCRRKYWAEPARTPHMHEVGLRILIRKVQLIGMQYDKALVPILSYYRDHYFRIFFKCVKGKKKCDEIVKKFGYYSWNVRSASLEYGQESGSAGPLYLGELFDRKLMKGIKKESTFLDILKNELDLPFFHDIHSICKAHKIAQLPKSDIIIDELKKKGFKASRTHFTPKGIKTDASAEEMKRILKK